MQTLHRTIAFAALTAATALLHGADEKAALVLVPRVLWPGATVPYVLDGDVPEREAVLQAMRHWSDVTPIRFVARDAQPDYVHVRRAPAGTCFSAVGVRGGEQFLDLGPACDVPRIVHEIGHAVGLFHEQSRADRDSYVRLLPENIVKSSLAQYQQHITDADAAGSFDFGSIMAYPRVSSDSRAPLEPVFETIPPGIPTGEAKGLSPQDAETVRRWYGKPSGKTVVTSVPVGLRLLVDGAPCDAPCGFDWLEGGSHTIEAPSPQRGGAVRFVFARWSDGGTAMHSVSASAGVPVYSAAFVRQYRFGSGAIPPEGGEVTVSPASDGGYYPEGTRVTVRASPKPGFSFTGWTGAPLPAFFGGVSGWGESPAVVRVSFPDMQYTAQFSDQVPVTIASEPPHARIAIDGVLRSTPLLLLWEPGSSHTIEAPESFVPASGTRCVFREWSDAGARLRTVGTGAANSFVARYGVQYFVSADVYPEGAGAVTVSPASPDGYYDAGVAVQLTAVPNAGQAVANWTGDLTGAGASRSVALRSDIAATVNFAKPGYLPYYAVVNGASRQPGDIAPGEVIAVFHADFAAGDAVRASFDGAAAQALAVEAGRAELLVPDGVAGKKVAVLQVERNGRAFNPVLLGVAEASPAVFTADGSGFGPARTEDGGPGIVRLFATGVAGLPVNAEIDAMSAEVTAVTAAAPGTVQIDVRLASGTRTGAVPVRILAGGHPSPPGVTVAIQ